MKQQKEKNTEKRNRIYNILLIICIIGLVFSLSGMLYQYLTQRNAKKEYENMAAENSEKSEELFIETEQSEIAETRIDLPIPEKTIDWDALEEENSDIYAWIYIPNTQVDYPVLQSETDDNYYLDHNVDHSKGYPGAIYSQTVNARDFSDVWTVLYGHNMGNGTMFGSLHKFEDNEFFEENRYIYIYTRKQAFVYEIYSACTFQDKLLSDSYSFTFEVGAKQFLNETAKVRDMNSHIREKFVMPDELKMLTLSTCIKGSPDKRWLVSGILVESVEN